MAGKFTNTQVLDMSNSLLQGAKDRFNNNMYQWNGMTITPVTYLNIDKEKSTFDEGTGQTYSGYSGSFKFNQINNVPLQGLEKVLLNYDFTDEGLNGYEITGDCILIPNAGFIPYAGDHFAINYIDEAKEILFRVIEVQDDTLSNKGNSYKLTYKLITTNIDTVKQYYTNVINTYEFLNQNVGTGRNPLILTKTYNEIVNMDELLTLLRNYYRELFYNNYVQAFVFTENGLNFYDSYMTEFLKKSSVVSSEEDYIHISHQLNLPADFFIKYTNTFFYNLIKKDKDRLTKVQSSCYGILIDSKINIFSTRYEEYFSMQYETIEGMNPTFLHGLVFDPFNNIFINNIINNTKTNNVLDDIIIKYYNGEEINDNDIKALYDLDLTCRWKLFYYVPCVIYILESNIKQKMK